MYGGDHIYRYTPEVEMGGVKTRYVMRFHCVRENRHCVPLEVATIHALWSRVRRVFFGMYRRVFVWFG